MPSRPAARELSIEELLVVPLARIAERKLFFLL